MSRNAMLSLSLSHTHADIVFPFLSGFVLQEHLVNRKNVYPLSSVGQRCCNGMYIKPNAFKHLKYDGADVWLYKKYPGPYNTLHLPYFNY